MNDSHFLTKMSWWLVLPGGSAWFDYSFWTQIVLRTTQRSKISKRQITWHIFIFHAFSYIIYIIIHFHWFRWKRRKPWALVFSLLKETSFSHGFQYIDDLRSTGKGANICLKPYDRRGNGSRSNMAWMQFKTLEKKMFPKMIGNPGLIICMIQIFTRCKKYFPKEKDTLEISTVRSHCCSIFQTTLMSWNWFTCSTGAADALQYLKARMRFGWTQRVPNSDWNKLGSHASCWKMGLLI